jgi:hypothetical protein
MAQAKFSGPRWSVYNERLRRDSAYRASPHRDLRGVFIVEPMPMQRIEGNVRIADDRRLILQLPDTVQPGEHRIVVTLDASVVDAIAVTRSEDGILVFNGIIEGDFQRQLSDVREERIAQFLPNGARP